ncbi:uncharacterized protein BJ212DRAFT_1301469 [Suillus subaureus]|uniref:Uncharacterized protein n=1 Tax=Suillus subaureus TaxID=48587 RepID=A0A9P7JBA5_9AGAM|nr:uncharacterized protein BJ212DRAFT_1301469 [Suillus subaureus]KAG1812456.1 hypothetical protein BJ212DRAFT_1301469 [Suillus subaureus]
MSTPVDTSLTGLKASTAQIMAIISGTQQIPLGSSHFALTSQAHVVKEYGAGPLPGIMLLCSKELMCIQSITPQVWPNWHSIGYDNPHLLKHIWCAKLLTWEVLGDHAFGLPVAAHPSTGLIPVDLPSPPILASNVPSPSTNTTTKYWDKGKGKSIVTNLEPETKGSRKRKSPMILALSSQPLKSAMKTHKCTKSSRIVKSKPIMELEDEEDTIIQVEFQRVPMKKPFGPATVIASSHPAVIKPSKPTPETPVQVPPVINAGDILIPRLCIHTLTQPTEQPMPGLQQARLALHNSVGQEDWESMTPSKAPSKAPPASQSKAQTYILLSLSLAVPAAALDVPEVINWHPSFPIPDPPANATSLLLDQSIPTSMSPPESALPPLIDLSMAGMVPIPPKFKDASAIEGLLFEYNQVVHPEDPDMPGEIVDLGDLSNLVPEYNSSNDMDVEMDVEVKVEVSSEEVDMAT